ncbi:LysM repeat protein [Nocardioides ginsengisegetis]|uniref:LysM repeat protein n=1 Tax=Nocardioides ginsengisegetis TaxID=661491 RepID=A0A7W3P994_9ACTN|nr:LysM peptidoglycan-binding domain-containing protein [Nocardioides ginsengisegetis]MBA8803219.1 LysM repeat protein [Nocardioides ginsengisegetis]
MSTLRCRIIGLCATLALLVMVVATPVVLVAIRAVPSPGDFSPNRLTSPDDGTLAVAVIGVVAWLAWLVFTTAVALELAARTRRIRVPHLPGLAIPQLAAGRLVALASLLFVAVPTGSQVPLPTPTVAVVPVHTTLEQPRINHIDTVTPTVRLAAAPLLAEVQAQTDETIPYTVRRGDSLWKIAQQQLGEGRRYDEIVALNEAVLHGRPDFITAGTVLRIPHVTPSAEQETYVVQRGDTLSEIAEVQLGDASAYPTIFEASREIEQPDGGRLTDPDLIRPGWRLTIPGHADGDEPDEQRPADPSAAIHADPTAPIDREDPPPTSPAPTDGPTNLADTDGTSTPGWLLPGLAGAGAILAGSLLIVLRQHRRTQQRYRRPGRIIVSTPPELRPVEKSAHHAGSLTAPRIDVLDKALRHLSTACAMQPRLLDAELGTDSITLHLGKPAVLPQPWHGERTSWSARLDSDFGTDSSHPAPYPLLVSLGQSDDGALSLVNLEELRSITVTGDAAVAAGLGRHLAAELSLNPWSVLVEIDTFGIAAELATIDPLRLHHHDGPDAAFLERLSRDLAAEGGTEEPDRFRALLTTAEQDPHAFGEIAKILTAGVGRPGGAVVTIGGEASDDTVEMHVTSIGRLVIKALELDLVAAGLTAEEATACAAIVDLTRQVDDEAIPSTPEADGGPPLTDQAGAIRLPAAEPRPPGPAGPASLLPLAATTYEQKAATTTADVEQLAPVVPPDTASRVADRDPDLDGDLTVWADPNSRIPRLTLLGPVNARTAGDATAVARRKPFYVELLAYLALHPNGVTTPQVCDAFGLKPDRARTDLAVVRRWLGIDGRTGELHLPSARARAGHHDRGTAVYQLQGVLTDMDLFRRLRARGQSRGEDGIADLVTALDLVSGEPFTELRPAGWSWLLDGDRLDHIMTCAIVDVAHIVTTHALSVDDFELARRTAETAYRAAPDDETSRLDLIQVAAATGHADLAERQLIDDIFNRSDDGLGPVAVPDRTAHIAGGHGWARRTRASR